MEKLSRIDWSQIECTKCGHCCPNRCKHKTPEGLCDAHPTLVGQSVADKLQGLKCSYSTPANLFANHIYCEPIVNKIVELTGVKTIPIIKPGHGRTVTLANFEQVWKAYEKIHPFDRSKYNDNKPREGLLKRILKNLSYM